MKQKIKVRFHLAQGENYMHWQIKYENGNVQYFDPKKFQLVMFECKLRNQKGTAEKICYEGQNKTVCAWIECDEVIVSTIIESDVSLMRMQVSYNPRVEPNWTNGISEDLDNTEYHIIKSINNKLYVVN